jgi:hypothetical protein
VHLACVVKEAIPEQIEQFQPRYWASDELYLDEEMAFYKAIGGGEVAQKGLLALVSSEVRANNRRSKAYIAEHGLDSNLSGEGMILGGLLVLRADEGGIVMQKNESTFGTHPAPALRIGCLFLTPRWPARHGVAGDIATVEEVIEAAQAAAYAGDEVPQAEPEPAAQPSGEER